MTDLYLDIPEELKGQPKRTIADYVEQNGVLVPRRFDTLAEARRSHKAILLRSEHPQDYDGVSGLLDSFTLSKMLFKCHSMGKSISFWATGLPSRDEIKKQYIEFLKPKKGYSSQLNRYCRFSEQDWDKMVKEISFSLWEHLPGINHTVIADTAIPNQHHVFSFKDESQRYVYDYALVENDQIVNQFSFRRDPPNTILEIVQIYEQIRHFPNFDSNHCPIMEFQTHKNKPYFLQYHRGRDFNPAQFELTREPNPEESEAFFVRGCTLPEGLDCKVTFYYAFSPHCNFDPEDEEGSFDLHFNKMFPELQVRKRKLQIIPSRNLDYELLKFAAGHEDISKLYKPEISTILRINNLMDPKKEKELTQLAIEKKNAYVNIHIVSDGRKAYLKLNE
tara:strand:+ start:707 stop:1879 length:1173 start_codon:yes stop_codon:yes gene_type:complete